MLKRKRLGRDIFLRGGKARVRSVLNTKYSLTLFEILKSYSEIITTRNFQKIAIPKLPVFTTEDGIYVLRKLMENISSWKNIKDFIPEKFKKKKLMRKTGNAGIFAASLELVKEGNLSIKQNDIFDEIYLKKNEKN